MLWIDHRERTDVSAVNKLAEPPDARSEHRQPGAHRLEDAHRKTLGMAGQYKDIVIDKQTGTTVDRTKRRGIAPERGKDPGRSPQLQVRSMRMPFAAALTDTPSRRPQHKYEPAEREKNSRRALKKSSLSLAAGEGPVADQEDDMALPTAANGQLTPTSSNSAHCSSYKHAMPATCAKTWRKSRAARPPLRTMDG